MTRPLRGEGLLTARSSSTGPASEIHPAHSCKRLLPSQDSPRCSRPRDSHHFGLSRQRAQHLDIHLIDQVRNLLFADPPGSGGRDLPAINIQRGRYHGIPSYNHVRRAYGRSPARSFAEVSSDPVVQGKLSEAFGGEIARLELWPGGLAEDHLPGAMLGETFHAIVADQFRRLRDGDRFWFENDPYFLANANLLEQIGSVTLADIIRRNTLVNEKLSDNVFQQSVPQGQSVRQPSFAEGL